MNPAILHADGTECRHAGQAVALDGEVLCPAGVAVTHVRFNGQVVAIEQATAAFVKMAEATTEGLKPLVAAFAQLGRTICASPTFHALADGEEVAEDAALQLIAADGG